MSTAALNLGRMRHRRRSMRGLGDDYLTPGSEEFSLNDSNAAYGADSSSSNEVPTIDFPLPDQIPYVPVPSDTSNASVSVQQLQQENAQGLFNKLKTPQPYFGQNTSQYTDPYGNPLVIGVGPNGGLFTAYQPVDYGGNVGSGGAVGARYGVPAVTPASITSSTPAAAATSLTSWFSQPVVAGSSITWGWVLLGGLALWLLMRNN